jgi:FtsZ-binding cell division protein ZapB
MLDISEQHTLPLQKNALRIEAPVNNSPRCLLQPKKMPHNIDPFYWVNHGGAESMAFYECGCPYTKDWESCWVHVNNKIDLENLELQQKMERALKAIDKLRLEIKILKEERQHLFDFIQKAKNMPEFEGDLQKKAAITLLKAKLEKERFI